LGVYDDGSQHCFACGYHQHPREYVPVNSHTEKVNDKAILPADFTREVPARAWQWLLQYGLPYSYWKAHCGYSETDDRLVFTVGDPVVFSIGRYIGVNEAVGNHKQRRKWYVWGDSHKHAEIINPKEDTGGHRKIVLVEDLISAHKVGQVTTAIPLFGTNIHPCHKYYLIQERRPIVLWLDKDQDHSVRAKAASLQALTGVPVDVIITDDDPKTYSINQIKELTDDQRRSVRGGTANSVAS
jgi:hypothetical protein